MKALLVLALFLVACNPVKKALQVARQNPNEFSGFCAEIFPVGESVTVRDSVRFDTLYKESDPVTEYEYHNDTVVKIVRSPGTTYFVTKTVTKDSLIIRRDTAKEVSLQKKADDALSVCKNLQDENSGLKKFKKITIWALVLLVIGSVGGIVIKKFLL